MRKITGSSIIIAANAQLSCLNKANISYGLLGFLFFTQLASGNAWKSFCTGWLVSIVNLEIIKRLGKIMVEAYAGHKPSGALYVLLLSKFVFWGLVIAFFTKADRIQAIPFVLGTLTLVISGMTVGIREFVNARAA